MSKPLSKVLLCLGLIFVGALLYSKSLSNPFVLDDLTKIRENLDLRVPFDFSNFVYPYAENSMHFRNDPSRPLTYMVYWACWHVGHGAPVWFHVTSLTFHILNAILIALITLELSTLLFSTFSFIAAGISGLLFLTSPLMAGTAIYAYGLSDVLSTTLMLAGLWLALISKRRRAAVLVCLCFIGALATKQSTIVLPALIFAAEIFTKQKIDRRRILNLYAPLTLIAVFYLIFRFGYFGMIGDIEGRNGMIPLSLYAPAQGTMILKYLLLTFWPFHLSVDHREIPGEISIWWYALCWAVLLTVTAISIWIARQKRSSPIQRTLGFGWIFFFICLLPVSSIFPTVDLLVERRAYSAEAGLFFILGLLFLYLSPQLKKVMVVVVLIAAALQSIVVQARIEVYGSPELLWREALELDPENPRALINLGVYYSIQQRWEDSEKVLQDLLKLQPENGAVYSKIAYIYLQPTFKNHNSDVAWKYLSKALELDSENIFALYNAGVLKLDTGDLKMAEDFFRRAIRLAPLMTASQLALAKMLKNQNRNEEAVGFFKEVLRLEPGNEYAQKELRELGVPY